MQDNIVHSKRCYKCKATKLISLFGKDASRPDGINHLCKACHAKEQKARDARRKQRLGPEKFRHIRHVYELGYHYGLSQAEYDMLSAIQGDSCAICMRKPERALAVDHDHKTGTIRGLLCRTCNSAIGLMKDNPEHLRRAADYLENWRSR